MKEIDAGTFKFSYGKTEEFTKDPFSKEGFKAVHDLLGILMKNLGVRDLISIMMSETANLIAFSACSEKLKGIDNPEEFFTEVFSAFLAIHIKESKKIKKEEEENHGKPTY